MPLFTVEEINFMSYFDTSSRHALIRDMENTPLSAMDAEMSRCCVAWSAARKNVGRRVFGALYAPDTLMD
jgi:hypothetical protein